MKYILGIDVGGTKIAAGLVDSKNKITNLKVLPTSQSNLLDELIGLIGTFRGYSGIGLGVPGQVLKDGTVTRLPNVRKFGKTNLKRILKDRFKVPVSVVNDAKAFALGSAVAGEGKAYNSVAGIILGTGIGIGFVLNKNIYFGKDGLAGELEHVPLLDGKMIRDRRHAEKNIFSNAAAAKKYLKTILAMTVLSFNPDIIVLGGAWSKLPGMEKLANNLATNAGGYVNKTPVKVSRLSHAGVIGATLPLKK